MNQFKNFSILLYIIIIYYMNISYSSDCQEGFPMGQPYYSSPGYYDSVGDNNQLPCPAGSYCQGGLQGCKFCFFMMGCTYVFNTNAMKDCPIGHYCPAISYEPTQCYPGCGCGMKEVEPCSKPCGSGTYALLSPCLLCDWGTYSNYWEQTSCDFYCGKGQTTVKLGSTVIDDCKECEPGTYNEKEYGQCKDCGISTYQPDSGQAYCLNCSLGYEGFDRISCDPCELGSYNDVQGEGSVCKPCPIGSFGNDTGLVNCFPCGKGKTTFQQQSISVSQCIECSPGWYSNKEVGTCRICQERTYNELNGSSVCTSCPFGEFSPEGSDKIENCYGCQKGYHYNNITNFCDECQPGSYNPKENSDLSCKTCPIGTFQPSNTSYNCLKCPFDTFNINNGSYSSEDCIDCPYGFHTFLKGSGSIYDCNITCSSGFYYSIEERKCFPCPISTHNMFHSMDLNSSCIKCDPGYYSNLTGTVYCDICPAGYYTPPDLINCKKCPRGRYSKDASTICENCPFGFIVNSFQSGCETCKSGEYYMTLAFFHEEFNSFTLEGKCISCPSGTYNPKNESNDPNDCIPCEKGYFSKHIGSEICTPCEKGSFSNENAGSTYCELCPSGTYNQNQASKSIEDCLKCSKGSYSPERGSKECLNCSSGTYSDIEGSRECKLCPLGKYINVEGSKECNSCPIGYYAPGKGLEKCFPCPNGMTTKTNGSFHCNKEEEKSLSFDSSVGPVFTSIITTNVVLIIFIIIVICCVVLVQKKRRKDKNLNITPKGFTEMKEID